MSNFIKHLVPLKSAVVLVAFTAVSIFLVSLTANLSKERIAHNEQLVLIKQFSELAKGFDNDILNTKTSRTITIHGFEQPINIYTASKNNVVFGYLVEHTYPRGYNGNIRLLTAVNPKLELLGVRVITHRETPGLGDKAETRKSDWIQQFAGLSLENPTAKNWKVKPDGGVFDAFTGATITPRAIVTATYEMLTYLKENEPLGL